jgi:hypothetical protein
MSDSSDVRVTPPDGIPVNVSAEVSVPSAQDHPHDVRVAPPAREPVPGGPLPEDLGPSESHPADVRVARAGVVPVVAEAVVSDDPTVTVPSTAVDNTGDNGVTAESPLPAGLG